MVELLITLAIFSIISSLVLARYPEFQAGISLKRTAQEMALSVREAGVYATGVREWGDEYGGYGIHFDSSSERSYVLFSDIDNDNFYDGGNELVKEFAIQTKDRINDICGYDADGDSTCGLNYLDIIFRRPMPLIIIKGDGADFSYAEIEIRSPRGKERDLRIEVSGQISVE